ncbi:MAG: 3-hydroxyacyl-CoA dehydrogenase NAD-binding domain-containing protein, partial [Cyclobacteriaceae bacterium]
MPDKLTVGIIGYGTMGSGIAQVAATAGCQVLVYETNRGVLAGSSKKLDKILARLIEKGKIDQAKSDQISGNIKPVDKLLDFGPCDLVIEAIIEDPKVKKNV